MTYEQLVEKLKASRARSERAQAQYFLDLLHAERDLEAVWRVAGIEDFEDFLQCHNLAKINRYRLFRLGVDRIGEEAALQHGLGFTIEIGSLRDPNPQTIENMNERASDFETIEHVAPSQQTAERWRREFDGPGKQYDKTRQVSELSRLRAENAQLKAELKAAKAKIKKLEEKLKRSKPPSKSQRENHASP